MVELRPITEENFLDEICRTYHLSLDLKIMPRF